MGVVVTEVTAERREVDGGLRRRTRVCLCVDRGPVDSLSTSHKDWVVLGLVWGGERGGVKKETSRYEGVDYGAR